MENKTETRLPLFQVIIIGLSIYVLGSLVVSTLFKPDPEVQKLLDMIDNAICFVFLADFLYRLYHAENKWKFMQWGWIDLISSIPTLDYFRAGRLLRLIRLLRILRAFRSTKILLDYVFKRKAYGAFTMVSLVAVLMLIFSSLAILQAETAENSNIKTAEDALWWAYTTITTVGYGDKYPVTTEGRAIAVLLMTVGVGLFGTFAGFVASWFVKSREQGENAKE